MTLLGIEVPLICGAMYRCSSADRPSWPSDRHLLCTACPPNSLRNAAITLAPKDSC